MMESAHGSFALAVKLDEAELQGNVENNVATWAVQKHVEMDLTYFVYVVHLRIPAARLLHSEATHEIGVFVKKASGRKTMLVMFQIDLENDRQAERLLDTLVAGLVEGHLPLTIKATDRHIEQWSDCASEIVQRWENPLLH